VDTSALIAYFEGGDETNAVAIELIDVFVKTGRNAALLSPVTAMEILVRPLRTAPAGVAHVHEFLTKWPNLSLVAADIHVAQEAAALRATHNFKVPDALVIATGIVAQVEHLITNDKEWRRRLAPLKDRVKITELLDYR
jgi:predicted nucleic acid-binding protein